MPSGRVKWYDADKGFGFVSQEGGGEDVFVPKSALPTGVTELKKGQRVEYGIADGRRGPQALSVRLLEAPPSVTRMHRKPADDMAVIVEDLVKLLDRVGGQLRRGHYPGGQQGRQIAAMLRRVADDLDA